MKDIKTFLNYVFIVYEDQDKLDCRYLKEDFIRVVTILDTI